MSWVGVAVAVVVMWHTIVVLVWLLSLDAWHGSQCGGPTCHLAHGGCSQHVAAVMNSSDGLDGW